MIRDTPAGVELDVRVIPRAHKTTIDGVRGAALLVRVVAIDGVSADLVRELIRGIEAR